MVFLYLFLFHVVTTISSVNASQITSRIATPSVASRSLAQTPLSSDARSFLQSVTPGGVETTTTDSSMFSVSVQPNLTMYSTRDGGFGVNQFGKVGQVGAKWKSNNNEAIDPLKPNNHPILQVKFFSHFNVIVNSSYVCLEI